MSKAAMALAVLAGASGVSVAQELWFAEYAFQNAQFSAVNTDGTNPHTLFPLPPDKWLPLGATYSPAVGRFFWMDSAGPSEVTTANPNGTGLADVTPVPGFARGAQLDAAGRIYFSTNNTIMRVELDGSLTTLWTSVSSDPIPAAPRVDRVNGHVYFGAENKIYRMDLDGSNVKTVVAGVGSPRAVAVDVGAGYAYWADGDTISDFIGRVRLDGSDFRVLVDISPNNVTSSGLIDVLVDPAGGDLYWADEFTTAITRADLDGANAAVIYTGNTRSPSGLTMSTGEPAQAVQDCDGNGVPDSVDIGGGAPDCDNNGVIDTCQPGGCTVRTFHLDQGSNAADFSGRALGVPSQWQVFQPFDVPAGGWCVGEVGVDGYTTNYIGPDGVTLTLFPDNPATQRPDETVTLATTTTDLRFGTNFENWVYAPVNVQLAEGRYWLRIEANDPVNYGGSINHGFSGLPSRSRGSSGNFTGAATPVALRLTQGAGCPPACDPIDFNGDGLFPDNSDLEDFLSVFGGGACSTGTCGDIDFNNDGLFPDNTDIEEFFDVFGGGACG